MELRQAKDLLEPYDIVILHDHTLKLYKIFFHRLTLYISEKDMSSYDEETFKEVISTEIIKEAVAALNGTPAPTLLH